MDNAATSKPGTASIGVITDDCSRDNSIVREGILLELTKPNNLVSSRNVKDASIQTEKENSASSNHGESGTTIEKRLMEIEHECEERLRREMNAKLRLSAKHQAFQAMSKLERKHRDEKSVLRKQLAEERSRSKSQEQELLQAISKQQLSKQKELKEVEQKLERERLEKSMLESELGLLNDRMKEFQISRFSDNERSERALTTTMNNLEEQKRQFQIGVAEAVRERDRYQLMLASKSELLIHKTKQFEQTQQELLKKLVKTESALNAKNSEAAALRALLKHCQSALESLSYKDESCPCPYNDCVPHTSKQKAATAHLALPIQPTHQAIVGEKEERSEPEETKVTSRNGNGQYFEKKHLGDPPPCTSSGDPPEEMLASAQQQSDEEDKFSVKALVPKEIEIDCGNSTEESLLPMQESIVKSSDTSQSQPGVPESADNDEIQIEANEGTELALEIIDCKKLPPAPEHYTISNDEAETTQKDVSSSAVRADESNKVNTDSSSSSGTDDYSMGSFCTWDQKLDKQGRVNFIHIK
eukprot:scaffold12685_cov143-Skeletonema_menzelii.AAC.2